MAIKVLVIDDDPDMVETLCQYLEIKEFEVVGRGYNGQDAVELYKKTKPDVLFLDVMMPYFDGFYALENIHVFDPVAVVVMITGDIRPKTHTKLKKFVVSAVVPKPFDFSKVAAIVDNLLAKKGQDEDISKCDNIT